MVVIEEGLQHHPVGLQAVGPVVLAHQPLGRPHLLVQERQGDLGGGGVGQGRHGHPLGRIEGLEERYRQPGVLVHQGPAHAEQVHDRKHPGAFEPVGGRRLGIGEQPADVRRALEEARRRAGRDQAIDLAGLQHARQGLAGGGGVDAHAVRQVESGLLDPPGLLLAALHPPDVRRVDAVVVEQDGPGPDIGGELVLGDADPAALQVLGAFDPLVGADVDGGVAEGPRREHRHAHIGAVARGGPEHEGGQGQFADVEGLLAEGAEEHLLRLQMHEHRRAPVDADPAVGERLDAVVVADGDGEGEFHGVSVTTSRGFRSGFPLASGGGKTSADPNATLTAPCNSA